MQHIPACVISGETQFNFLFQSKISRRICKGRGKSEITHVRFFVEIISVNMLSYKIQMRRLCPTFLCSPGIAPKLIPYSNSSNLQPRPKVRCKTFGSLRQFKAISHHFFQDNSCRPRSTMWVDPIFSPGILNCTLLTVYDVIPPRHTKLNILSRK